MTVGVYIVLQIVAAVIEVNAGLLQELMNLGTRLEAKHPSNLAIAQYSRAVPFESQRF